MRTRGRSPLSGTKIRSRTQLASLIARLKAQGKRIVFTNGCFDILHHGHTRYLEAAKACGDVLVVGVNSDASVKRIKGPRRPIVGQRDRAGVIAALASVDYVVVFSEDTPLKTIQRIKPDVLVKGSDWDKGKIVGADIVFASGGSVVRVPLLQGRSTTNLIEKVAKTFSGKRR